MPKKKTFEEFKEEVYELVKDEYTLLSTKYVNNKTKVKMKHNKCGYEYEVAPNKFLVGRRCPKCFGTPKKNIDIFKEEVYNLVKDEYSVLGNYVNNNTKILMKHNKCNYEYMVKPIDFIRGNKCPKCSREILRKKLSKSIDIFKEEVYNLVKDEYSVLGEYVNNNTKILMKHNKCNHEYMVTPDKFLQGRRCPNCSKFKQKNTEIFSKEVFEVTNGEYELVSDYLHSHKKVTIKHNKCNNFYETLPYIFSNGHRCPYCKSSRGEERIRKYLEDKNIYFQEQYSFPDCKNIYTLKFDFMLEDDSGKIILIEYDGEQHFKECYYSEESKLIEQQKRDKIKDDYCNNNDNIDLYRISYKEFNNIETILEEIINSYE